MEERRQQMQPGLKQQTQAGSQHWQQAERALFDTEAYLIMPPPTAPLQGAPLADRRETTTAVPSTSRLEYATRSRRQHSTLSIPTRREYSTVDRPTRREHSTVERPTRREDSTTDGPKEPPAKTPRSILGLKRRQTLPILPSARVRRATEKSTPLLSRRRRREAESSRGHPTLPPAMRASAKKAAKAPAAAPAATTAATPSVATGPSPALVSTTPKQLPERSTTAPGPAGNSPPLPTVALRSAAAPTHSKPLPVPSTARTLSQPLPAREAADPVLAPSPSLAASPPVAAPPPAQPAIPPARRRSLWAWSTRRSSVRRQSTRSSAFSLRGDRPDRDASASGCLPGFSARADEAGGPSTSTPRPRLNRLRAHELDESLVQAQFVQLRNSGARPSAASSTTDGASQEDDGLGGRHTLVPMRYSLRARREEAGTPDAPRQRGPQRALSAFGEGVKRPRVRRAVSAADGSGNRRARTRPPRPTNTRRRRRDADKENTLRGHTGLAGSPVPADPFGDAEAPSDRSLCLDHWSPVSGAPTRAFIDAGPAAQKNLIELRARGAGLLGPPTPHTGMVDVDALANTAPQTPVRPALAFVPAKPEPVEEPASESKLVGLKKRRVRGRVRSALGPLPPTRPPNAGASRWMRSKPSFARLPQSSDTTM